MKFSVAIELVGQGKTFSFNTATCILLLFRCNNATSCSMLKTEKNFNMPLFRERQRLLVFYWIGLAKQQRNITFWSRSQWWVLQNPKSMKFFQEEREECLFLKNSGPNTSLDYIMSSVRIMCFRVPHISFHLWMNGNTHEMKMYSVSRIGIHSQFFL